MLVPRRGTLDIGDKRSLYARRPGNITGRPRCQAVHEIGPLPSRLTGLSCSMVRGASALFAVILATTLAHLAAQQAIFRAGTELVSLTATVTDRRGQHLTDLAREDFEVLEDGK